MKNILIIDVETTGLDPQVDKVLEVAAILYSIPHATVIAAASSIMRSADNAAEFVNRIPSAILVDAPDPIDAWMPVMTLADRADAVTSYNASFDYAFSPPALQRKPWFCSKDDIAWPKATKPGQTLVALVLAHDLGVATAHRAMADCDLLARLFTRCHELGSDLQVMVTRAMRPKGTFVALVCYDDKNKARDAGFRWEPTSRCWKRSMAIEDVAALPFATRQVEDAK